MWILIMTLVTFNGAAIGTAEFKTEQACKIAANEWGDKVKGGSREVTTICRPQE